MNCVKRAAAILAAAWMSVAGSVMAAGPAAVFDVGSLHVERYGESGSPVILIPGLASGAWVWKDSIAALQGEHRVYAVTLAGFDGVPAVKGDVLEQAAASLKALIISQHLDRPVLVGHSLGGTLALQFATTHSDLIAGVAAVDGLPVFPTTEAVPEAQRKVLAERIRAQFAGITASDFGAQQLQYMQRVGVVDATQALATAALTTRSDPHAVADYAGAVMELDLRPQLPGIRVPVLVVVPYLASDYAALGISESAKGSYYRSLLPGVAQLEVVTLAPARHFVMLDQPQAFNEALRRFIGTSTAR
jgi:pimeloyl-ACP methyl ester carboxylesterase